MQSLKDLFKDAKLRSYAKKQVILHAGDEIDQLFFIKKGFVKVYAISDEGEQHVLLIRRPGEIFPLIRVLNAQNYRLQYYYEAITMVEVALKDRFELANEISRSRSATRLLLEQTLRLSNDLTQRLQTIESKDAINKVAMLLPYLIQICGRPIRPNLYRLGISLTHQDIADMLGLTRETATIQVQKLKQKKIMSRKSGSIIINAKKLKLFNGD